MFDDLITHRAPPPNRVGLCDGGEEQYLSEGAVMVAFAMHLLRTIPGLSEVSIHPDGEHGKRFDFQGWLGKRGFTMKKALGKTSYGGTYASLEGKTVVVNPSSAIPDIGPLTMPRERPESLPVKKEKIAKLRFANTCGTA